VGIARVTRYLLHSGTLLYFCSGTDKKRTANIGQNAKTVVQTYA